MLASLTLFLRFSFFADRDHGPFFALSRYVALMLLFRVAGRRSLADLTTFDFVLLLIIGEATQ